MGKTKAIKPKSVKSTGIVKHTRKNLNEIKGVQGHGKVWENQIISVIVSPSKLDEALGASHTATHDIAGYLNKKKRGTNVSIKATGTNRVDFGDARRTIRNLQKNSPLDAIIVKYKQKNNQKVPISVMQIDLIRGKSELLGNIDETELLTRIQEIDILMKKREPEYKQKTKELQKLMRENDAALVIAPKIGNPDKNRASRVQISVNISKFAQKYPHLVTENTDCKVYGEDCLSIIESGKRILKKEQQL